MTQRTFFDLATLTEDRAARTSARKARLGGQVDRLSPKDFQLGVEPIAPTTASEQLRAAFRLENTVAAVTRSLAEENFDDVNDFNPLDNLLPGEELIADTFIDAQSPGEMALIRERIKAETEARRLLAQGPLNSFLASTIAIVADPLTFLPIGGALLKTGKLSTRFATVGVASALDVATAEAILQQTQEIRPLSESLTAILLGGAFGLTVGGITARLAGNKVANRKVVEAYAKAVDDQNTINKIAFPEQIEFRFDEALEPVERAVESTAGAQRVPEVRTAEDSLPVGSPRAQTVLRAFGKMRSIAAPSVELMTSQFRTARELAQRLVDTGIVSQGASRGLADPVSIHTKIKRHDNLISATGTMLKLTYRQYRKRVRLAGDRPISAKDFREEVARASRRNNISEIPEVTTAARSIRKNAIDPLKDRAIKVKFFPEDVEVSTAQSYFTRVYDRGLITARRGVFRARIVKWLESQNAKGKVGDIQSDLELRDIADQIIDTILGNSEGRIPFFKVPALRGPLKERTFDIPDELIEDFLVNDALEVTTRYIRTMSADVEFQTEFGRLDLDIEIGRLRDEKNELLNAIKGDTAAGAKRAAGIEAEFKRQAQLLQDLAAHIRGVQRGPTDARMRGLLRIGRASRNLSFTRLLGSVTLSSIPDLGLIVLNEGLARTMGALLTDFGRGFKGVKLGISEARLAGTASDLESSQRAAALMDIGRRYADETKLERGLAGAANLFSRVALLDHWNTVMKGITSSMVSTRILSVVETVARGGKVSARDAKKLATAGITPDDVKRIATQAEHWDREGSLILGNTADWTDPRAVDAFRNALLRDVDNVIITPGPGDAPLWTSTEWGKTVFQFKRFAMASTQRVLISGLQARDVSVLNGMMVMVGLGALGVVLRDLSAGGDVRERSAKQWAVEAVDRSGLTAMFFEFDSLSEKFLRVSPTSAFTGQEVSRFAGRDFTSQLLGPSAGLLSETGVAAAAAIEGSFTTADLHRARKLVPAQNVFYARFLFDTLEEAITQSFGLPERQPSTRTRRSTLRLPEQQR